YIKTFAPRFAAEQPQPIAPLPDTSVSAESLARGWQTYQTLQCGKCHGDDGRGTGAAASDFVDDWGQPLAAADLTEPWTFRGGATSDEIDMRFRAGMSGTPMPSFKDSASDGEMRDLANYVVSLARKPVSKMTAEEAVGVHARQD